MLCVYQQMTLPALSEVQIFFFFFLISQYPQPLQRAELFELKQTAAEQKGALTSASRDVAC